VDATRRFADVTAAAVRVMLNAVAIVGKCEEKSKRPRDGRPTRRSKCLLRGRRRRHPKSIFGSAFWERRCFQLAFRIASVWNQNGDVQTEKLTDTLDEEKGINEEKW